MYRSVEKLPVSVRITGCPGRASKAAASSLNRFTEVESATTVLVGAAPISRPIVSPTRNGRSIQRCSIQARISDLPHSRATTSATRCGVAFGTVPNELPSR